MTCDLYFNVGPTLIRFLCFGVVSIFSFLRVLLFGVLIQLCMIRNYLWVWKSCVMHFFRDVVFFWFGMKALFLESWERSGEKKELFSVLTLRKVVLPWPPRFQGWAELRQSFFLMSPRDF